MHCSVSTVASTVSTVRTACLQELFRFLANQLFNLSGKTPDNYVTLHVQSRWLPPSAWMMFVRSLIPSLSHVSYIHEPSRAYTHRSLGRNRVSEQDTRFSAATIFELFRSSTHFSPVFGLEQEQIRSSSRLWTHRELFGEVDRRFNAAKADSSLPFGELYQAVVHKTARYEQAIACNHACTTIAIRYLRRSVLT